MSGKERKDEDRTVKAAEWYVKGLGLREQLYDHYSELHARWVALRKEGKTAEQFKDYAVSEDMRDARERHPLWSAAVIEGIGEMSRIWLEAWYG